MTAHIHPTAVIEDGADIAGDVVIGLYCVIGPHVRLESGVMLKSHVVISGHTVIGAGTAIYPFASLGSPPQDLKYAGEESRLIVGKNNVIREYVTMNPGTRDGGMETCVGDNCLFMMAAHVAHDCRVGSNVIMANSAAIAGHVRVGDHAIIGGLSAVHQFIRIGEHAIIGGMSAVESDVIPYGRVKGDRAYLAGLNLVGLERRGFSKDKIKTLQKAFNSIFSGEGTLEQRLSAAAGDFGDDPDALAIIAFAQQKIPFPPMPAQKDINAPASGAKRLGIIAGGGQLPAALAKACEADGIEVFIVALKGRTDPAIVRGRAHIWTRLGALGCILRALHGHNVRDVVPIGSVRRPSLAELRPDMKAAAFFAAGIRGLGDNAVLSRLRRLFESEGFKIRGIQDFMPGLLAPEGPIGKYEPAQEHRADIRRGLEAARILGATDIGQAVIVQEGIVLGVEAAEGTDELIRRCAPLRRRGSKGVLVKICKPGQDRDLDLPTIGAATIENAAQSGLAGIAVAAGASLLADPQEIATLADKHKLFVIGIDTEGE